MGIGEVFLPVYIKAVRPLRLAKARSGLSELDVEEPVVSKVEDRVESRARSASRGVRT
jgi:hypothetical protein